LKTLVVLCLLCGVAGAQTFIVEPDRPPDPPSHTTLFGWRIGGGKLPVDGIELDMMSLGLMVEHRVYGNWRIAGEYEYVWLGVREDKMDPIVDGNGHRAAVSVRRTLIESPRLFETLRFYIDAELGGGMLLANESTIGTISQPFGMVGLRLGYTFIKLNRQTRASPVWEPEFVLRAIATKRDEPLGYFFGIGINWGD
jgi:hypothetical protein